MATKTTKKASVKKTATAKKAAPKKTVRAATAPVTEDIIIMDAHEMHHHDHEHGCGCGGHGGHGGGHCGCGANGIDCGCHGHCGCHRGCWGFIKKLFWILVVFALGFAACMCLCDGRHGGRRGPKMPVEFVNGCLDTTKITCPEFATRVLAADANNDNCITREEYRAFKKAKRQSGK